MKLPSGGKISPGDMMTKLGIRASSGNFQVSVNAIGILQSGYRQSNLIFGTQKSAGNGFV